MIQEFTILTHAFDFLQLRYTTLEYYYYYYYLHAHDVNDQCILLSSSKSVPTLYL